MSQGYPSVCEVLPPSSRQLRDSFVAVFGQGKEDLCENLLVHVGLYIFPTLSDFEEDGRVTSNDDNARHQKAKNHEKFLG